jgi:hypothetical protein
MTDDPGGNFASDRHRRVMAAVPNPEDEPADNEEVFRRTVADDFLDLTEDDLGEILADLEADGDVTQLKSGWRNTKSGFAVLTGPIAEDGGRAHE